MLLTQASLRPPLAASINPAVVSSQTATAGPFLDLNSHDLPSPPLGSAPRSLGVVSAKRLSCKLAQQGPLLNLRPQPYPELENPLELLSAVEPSVVIADGMSWQVVVSMVLAAEGMRKHMVGLPRSIYRTAADMATTCRLRENLVSFGTR